MDFKHLLSANPRFYSGDDSSKQIRHVKNVFCVLMMIFGVPVV